MNDERTMAAFCRTCEELAPHSIESIRLGYCVKCAERYGQPARWAPVKPSNGKEEGQP